MKWLVLLLLLPFLLVGGAIALNRPPLFDPPGVFPRLKTYLTTNVAQTASEHRQPELRTRVYPMDSAELRQATAAAMRELGWKDIRTQGDAIRGVAVTPLLRFRDDVTVHLAAAPGGGTRMDARSASRVGRGDLAANERHLLDLFARLDQRAVAQKSPPGGYRESRVQRAPNPPRPRGEGRGEGNGHGGSDLHSPGWR